MHKNAGCELTFFLMLENFVLNKKFRKLEFDTAAFTSYSEMFHDVNELEHGCLACMLTGNLCMRHVYAINKEYIFGATFIHVSLVCM